MKLPKFLQPYLASYDLDKLDINNDKELIITELLNKGDGNSLHWISSNYSKEVVKEITKNPLRGSWVKSVLNYWIRIFNHNISDEVYKKALINLNS